MTGIPQRGRILVGLLALVIAPTVRATVPDTADHCIRRFLAQDDAQPRYRAIRRLEAENGSRRGWLEAVTEYAPGHGFHYQVIAEGGSGVIRDKPRIQWCKGIPDARAYCANFRACSNRTSTPMLRESTGSFLICS